MYDLVFGILLPHGKTFVELGYLAFGAHDFAAQSVIIAVHSGDFRIKLLHGRNAVFHQKVENGGALLECFDLPVGGSRLSCVLCLQELFQNVPLFCGMRVLTIYKA